MTGSHTVLAAPRAHVDDALLDTTVAGWRLVERIRLRPRCRPRSMRPLCGPRRIFARLRSVATRSARA
jgi:hypothetical protein